MEEWTPPFVLYCWQLLSKSTPNKTTVNPKNLFCITYLLVLLLLPHRGEQLRVLTILRWPHWDEEHIKTKVWLYMDANALSPTHPLSTLFLQSLIFDPTYLGKNKWRHILSVHMLSLFPTHCSEALAKTSFGSISAASTRFYISILIEHIRALSQAYTQSAVFSPQLGFVWTLPKCIEKPFIKQLLKKQEMSDAFFSPSPCQRL